MAQRSTAYVFLIFLFLTLVLSLCIVNAVTYGRIASSKDTLTEVSPSGARVLMWINIVFASIIGLYLIYYIVILITSETAKNAYAAIGEKYGSFKQATVDTYGRLRGMYPAQQASTMQMSGPQNVGGMYPQNNLSQSPPQMNPFM